MQLTTISIRRMWIIIIICFLINAPCVIMQSDNRSCVVEPRGQSFAEQIISFAEAFNNKSFSVLVQSGIYNATNGSFMNFINFKNVTITTDASGDVNITCPKIGDDIFSGVGFVNSLNISIIGLNFMEYGPITSALYIFNSTNFQILDSTFHHNTDNGIQIIHSHNISIKKLLNLF